MAGFSAVEPRQQNVQGRAQATPARRVSTDNHDGTGDSDQGCPPTPRACRGAVASANAKAVETQQMGQHKQRVGPPSRKTTGRSNAPARSAIAAPPRARTGQPPQETKQRPRPTADDNLNPARASPYNGRGASNKGCSPPTRAHGLKRDRRGSVRQVQRVA